MRLGVEQGRIIGSLIEKQLTTPQQYPLSLNALVQACNQLSNRDPVVSYGERLVDETLVSLKEAGLVRFVHPSHGRSVTRYRQVLEERLGLDNEQLALVGVLLLRGPQTAGELRTRTERMAQFDGVRALEGELARLAGGPDPLVARLSRRPGQKEERWTQLLMDVPAGEETPWTETGGSGPLGDGPAVPLTAPAAPRAEPPQPSSMPPLLPALPAPASEVALLEAEVTALRGEVDDLRSEVADLRGELVDVRAALEDLETQLGGI